MYVRESYLLLMGVHGGREPSVYFCRQRGKDYERNTSPLDSQQKYQEIFGVLQKSFYLCARVSMKHVFLLL